MMFRARAAHLTVATSAGGGSTRLPRARRLAGMLALGLSVLGALSAAPAHAMSDAPEAPQTAASDAALRIGNTADLVNAVTQGLPPAQLTPIAARSGCGPQGCDTFIGPLRIDRDHGTLFIDGQQRALKRADHGAVNGQDLPDIDWASPRAYAVQTAGRAWGTCIQFPHEGLGKSGSAQRWTSVVLVPGGRSRVPVQAQRFVGYWASCDALAAGPRVGEVLLTVVERSALGTASTSADAAPSAPLEAARYLCSATGCTRQADTTSVGVDSANGALIWPRRVAR